MNTFDDPRPPPVLLELLQGCRTELIRVTAQHAIGFHNLQSSLAIVSLVVDYVFNTPERPPLRIDIAKCVKFKCRA